MKSMFKMITAKIIVTRLTEIFPKFFESGQKTAIQKLTE